MLSNKEKANLNIFADKIRLNSILSMGSFGSGHGGYSQVQTELNSHLE